MNLMEKTKDQFLAKSLSHAFDKNDPQQNTSKLFIIGILYLISLLVRYNDANKRGRPVCLFHHNNGTLFCDENMDKNPIQQCLVLFSFYLYCIPQKNNGNMWFNHTAKQKNV